jgi:hypothetical protein
LHFFGEVYCRKFVDTDSGQPGGEVGRYAGNVGADTQQGEVAGFGFEEDVEGGQAPRGVQQAQQIGRGDEIGVLAGARRHYAALFAVAWQQVGFAAGSAEMHFGAPPRRPRRQRQPQRDIER